MERGAGSWVPRQSRATAPVHSQAAGGARWTAPPMPSRECRLPLLYGACGRSEPNWARPRSGPDPVEAMVVQVDFSGLQFHSVYISTVGTGI